MNCDSILEPVDLYNRELKELHNQNTIKYFEELTVKSGINVEENKATIALYKNAIAKSNKEKADIAKAKIYRVILYILIVVFILISIYLVYASIQRLISIPNIAAYLIVAGLITLCVFFIIIIAKILNKEIRESVDLKEKYDKETKELQDIAWVQMSKLNRLYSWNIASELVEQTVPLIQMDQYFDSKKFEYLKEKYGFNNNTDPSISTNFIQSGSILGNPFLIINTYNQQMVSHTYTGSTVIHWTTVERDSKGNSRTVHHSQTLYASVTKPKPDYYYNTQLVYGNDAAPNLLFSRSPSGANGKKEKDIDKMVKSGEKKLEKKSAKSVSSGGNFTKLANSEFDVLFGAHDRNNEVEFRLLFTPLAQKNMITLLRSQKPYGDDFHFWKKRNLNYIMSNHSQKMDYYCRPEMFVSLDYEEAKRFFIDYNNSYFSSLFFDFAPLLSIPMYQQHKPKEYIYKNSIESNIPSFEHESLANSFDKDLFKPQEAVTPQILKTSFVEKNGEGDYVKVRSNAFKATPMLDIIPQLGGDGRTHGVPVHWILYEPVYKDTYMEVCSVDTERNEFLNSTKNVDFRKYMSTFSNNNAIIYERGLMSMLVNRELDSKEISKLKSFMKKEGEENGESIR